MSDEIKFEIGNKAEQLVFNVFDITTNRNHYPVKFRRLSDKLQELVWYSGFSDEDYEFGEYIGKDNFIYE